MARQPVIEQVDQPDPPRALDRRRVRRFDMVAVALLLPIICILATGFVFHIYPGWPRIGLGLMFFGVLYFIVWTLFEVFLGAIFLARCHLVWLRDRIDRRTDAVVPADDRDALFVKVVPRHNWPFEKAAT